MFDCFLQTNIILDYSPVQLMKSMKNDVEIKGMKSANVCVISVCIRRPVQADFCSFSSTNTRSILINYYFIKYTYNEGMQFSSTGHHAFRIYYLLRNSFKFLWTGRPWGSF